jgi:hypothetical protein
MVKVGSVRWRGRCSKHPRYDPKIDGLGGIRGGCRRCEMLLDIWSAHAKLIRLIREFGTREDTTIPPPASNTDRQMSLFFSTPSPSA